MTVELVVPQKKLPYCDKINTAKIRMLGILLRAV
jgi:hypothetical protein